MRKTFKICVSGMEPLERSKAIEIMSRALVAEYSKATIVTHDGNATDKAIDAIPTHVDVFIVCSESHHDVAGYEHGRVHSSILPDCTLALDDDIQRQI